MPLPEKDYYDLNSLAKRWNISLFDVQHYAETGKLVCSVHIDMRLTQIGIFKKQKNGKKQFEIKDRAYVEGLVGIIPSDCRKVFRNNQTDTIIFESLKINGEYLRLADNLNKRVQIEPKDIVVRRCDRDSFEKHYNLELISEESKVLSFRESDSNEYIPLRGFSGRPSIMFKIEQEMNDRSKNNTLEQSLSKESEYLYDCAKNNIKNAQIPKPASIRNALRNTYKKLKVSV